MQVNWSLVANIVSPFIALILGYVLTRISERKPKLSYYTGHVSSFTIQESGMLVFTHSIVVMNNGKKTAKNVRIGHNIFPNNYVIHPPKESEIVSIEGKRRELKISELIPSEQITVNYLYFPPITWEQINTTVKHDDGFGKLITVIPTLQFPKWAINLMKFFLFLGIVAFLYIVYEILSLII